VNNLPKVVTQQRRGRASNPRLLDRKSDALPLSHRACGVRGILNAMSVVCVCGVRRETCSRTQCSTQRSMLLNQMKVLMEKREFMSFIHFSLFVLAAC